MPVGKAKIMPLIPPHIPDGLTAYIICTPAIAGTAGSLCIKGGKRRERGSFFVRQVSEPCVELVHKGPNGSLPVFLWDIDHQNVSGSYPGIDQRFQVGSIGGKQGGNVWRVGA
jgi:hypothetical protein